MKVLSIIFAIVFLSTILFSKDLFEQNQKQRIKVTSFNKKDGTKIQFNDVKSSLPQLSQAKDKFKKIKKANTEKSYIYHRLNGRVYESHDLRNWVPYASFKQSEALSIQISEQCIKISPNPVYDAIFVDGIYGEYYEIYSIFGLKLMDGICYGQMNVSNLPTGIYVIQANGMFSKFIKM